MVERLGFSEVSEVFTTRKKGGRDKWQPILQCTNKINSRGASGKVARRRAGLTCLPCHRWTAIVSRRSLRQAPRFDGIRVSLAV
jgi:hypothetical protein